MNLKLLAWAAVLLIACSAVWSKREHPWVQALWSTVEPPPKPIQFDNGTVRQYAEPGSAATGTQATAPPGAMRKCVRGTQVTYTNFSCPSGFKEREVGGPPVNVLAGQAPAKPAQSAKAAAAADRGGADPSQARSGAQATLHQALDLSADEKLRQKMIDRAVESSQKK
jgi:hypothetical protein